MNRAISYILVVLSCLNISAFGQTGHRVTGAIAEKYLTENTRIAISKIIGNESLAEASFYVDEMKSSPKEFWKYKSQFYHYVTVPTGQTYDDVIVPEHGDAMYALTLYSKVLRDKTALHEDKVVALKFIIHIIEKELSMLESAETDEEVTERLRGLGYLE